VRHLRMVGVCLVAIFAVAAFASSSAMALPEWGKCEAKAGGKYSDGNCQTKAKKGTGTFEWKKGATLKNIPFSGHNIGSGGVLSTKLRICGEKENPSAMIYGQHTTRKKCEEAGGVDSLIESVSIECESESNIGEATGKNGLTKVQVKFTGCKIFGVLPCQNGNEGEINVNTLKGSLGYINKAEKKVGVLLEPAKKHGDFASFTCFGQLSIVVGVGNAKEGANYLPESKGGYDGIISPITPVNTMTSEYTQVFTINEAFENVPNKFEGKHISLLEDYQYANEEPEIIYQWSPAGEEITNVNKATEEGEIKA
jgi:hypothetical protein